MCHKNGLSFTLISSKMFYTYRETHVSFVTRSRSKAVSFVGAQATGARRQILFVDDMSGPSDSTCLMPVEK